MPCNMGGAQNETIGGVTQVLVFGSICQGTFIGATAIYCSQDLGVAQKFQKGGDTQGLVHVSTYQGSILVPAFWATAICERSLENPL